MSVIETLQALMRGERPAAGLLHTCRLEAFGIEAYGEEAIVQTLRRGTTDLSDAATIIEAPGHIGIFDGSTAVVADLHGGQVARMWRLGGGASMADEPGVSVAFDPDLVQARGDIFITLSDHPSLAADALPKVIEAGREISSGSETDYRARAFAIRAFGTASAGAALFAVYRLRGDSQLTSEFAMVAVHWSDGVTQSVRDLADEAAIAGRRWMPRVDA